MKFYIESEIEIDFCGKIYLFNALYKMADRENSLSCSITKIKSLRLTRLIFGLNTLKKLFKKKKLKTKNKIKIEIVKETRLFVKCIVFFKVYEIH